MESESPIIIQMFKNVKQIIELSKERNCWSLEELKNIDITHHNVSEILKQLLDKQPNKSVNESVDESVEVIDENKDMEEIN